MARRKKRSNNTKIIAGILIAVILIGGFFLIKNLRQSDDGKSPILAIGEQCNVFGSGTISASSFTCEGAECDAEAFATCTTKSSGTIPIVTARSKSTYYGETNHWVGVDTPSDTGVALQGYIFDAVVGTGAFKGETILTVKIPGTDGWLIQSLGSPACKNNFCLFIKKSADSYYRYTPGSTADIKLSTTPSGSGGTCASTEVCSGGGAQYQCSYTWSIKKPSGAIVKSGNLQYASSQSGQYTTGVLTLQQGEKLDIPGFPGQIKYALKDTEHACFVSQCNSLKTAIIKCNVDASGCGILATTETPCQTGEVCVQGSQGASCVSPVKVLSAQFEDQQGAVREGYAIDEPVYFRYHINSDTAKSATVTVELSDLSGNLIDKKITSITFPNTQSSIAQFAGLKNTGSYKATIKITYDGGLTAQPTTYQMRVANEISMEIIGSSEGAVKTIYTNKPASVELRVFDEAGKSTSATTTINAVLVEGNKRTSLQPTSKEDQEGIYKYFYTIPIVSVDSVLQVEAKATKLGFTTTQTKDLIVKPATIEIELPNIANLVDLAPKTTSTIEIKTTNPQGDLIDIDSMNIMVTLPGGRVETAPLQAVRISTGMYKADYTFGDTTGAYFFEITANKAQYLTKKVTTPAINIVSGGSTTQLECTTNPQCGVGRICVNNACVNDSSGGPALTYAIWGGLGLLVVVIIILGFVLFRRRKPQTPQSFTGL